MNLQKKIVGKNFCVASAFYLLSTSIKVASLNKYNKIFTSAMNFPAIIIDNNHLDFHCSWQKTSINKHRIML